MKKLFVFLMLLLLAFPLAASAQWIIPRTEVGGGYTHMSGDGGVDGFNFGASLWATHRVSLGFDYDNSWDNTHLGAFELTQTGAVISKSHLQNFLVGPRIAFPGVIRVKQTRMPRLFPFLEAEIGSSHLTSSLEAPATGLSQSGSDNAFTWLVGGGGDYRLSPHWVTRFKLDFLRTHFADSGQSRVRIAIGVAYTFGQRGVKEAADAQRKADEEEAEARAQKEAMEEAKCEVCRRRGAEEAEAKRKGDADAVAAAVAAESQKKTAEQFDREKQDLRARLLAHFNRVLPTTDTARGLVVDMDDVLFDHNKSNLRPEAREDLAKLSGVVLNYPSLHLTIEGHTDNSGSAVVNQTLSEQRASAVRDFLVNQGLDSGSLSAQGLGTNNPVADNGTVEGRQKNRRVEIVVSGEVIGNQIGR